MRKQIVEKNLVSFHIRTYNDSSEFASSGDNYYRVNKFCNDDKKNFYNWLDLNRTQELLEKYKNLMEYKDKELIYKINNHNIPSDLKKYYIHPNIVHHLYEWHDLDYSIKVSKIMNMINEESRIRNVGL